MRVLLLGSLFLLAAADTDVPKCIVDGGEAASDLMDAAIFVWGATQRCGGDDSRTVKCEIDIASAVQSVSSMINTVLKVVGRCGHDFEPDCGRAATRLTKALAGLGSAMGGIKQKCHPDFEQPSAGGALPGTQWMHGATALCVLDVKDTAKNLLKSIKYLASIEKNCDDSKSRKCTANSLKVVGGLAALGEYLAASVGDCAPSSQMAHTAECAQESIMLVHHVTKIAEAGTEISKACAPKPKPAPRARVAEKTIYRQVYALPRKYEEEGNFLTQAKSNLVTVSLGAFLPLTAVVSFFAGKHFANRRTEDQREVDLE